MKKLVYFGIIPWLMMILSFSLFLNFENYSFWAYLIIYLCLFGLPFLWALPINMDYINEYNLEKALFIGIGTVILFGIFHLMLGDGDGIQPFLYIIAFGSSAYSTSCMKK